MTELEARKHAASWGLEFEVRICMEEGHTPEEALEDWDIPIDELGPHPQELMSDKQFEKLKREANTKYSNMYYKGKLK